MNFSGEPGRKAAKNMLRFLSDLKVISKKLYKQTLNEIRDSKKKQKATPAESNLQSSTEQVPEWVKYWNDVGPRLSVYLHGNTDARIIRYFVNCIAIYSWLAEDWAKKTTKHPELRDKLSIFIVETQDLMRGILASYEHMTMAPLALLLRTAFEIHVNLKYVVRSDDPAKWADLFDRFQHIEQILGIKSSAQLPSPKEEDFKRVAAICPEWFEPGTIKLKKDEIHWTATKTNLRLLAEAPHVDLGEQYVGLYKVNSKFTHASPLIRNLYRKGGSLHSIPSRDQCGMFALLAMGQCMAVLQESCEFFGVEFPEYDYAIVCGDATEVMTGERLDPKDFPKE